MIYCVINNNKAFLFDTIQQVADETGFNRDTISRNIKEKGFYVRYDCGIYPCKNINKSEKRRIHGLNHKQNLVKSSITPNQYSDF